MKLGAVILRNEQTGKAKTNHQVVRAKLKELVNNYPEKVTDLLTSLKIRASIVAPKVVLYSTLVKHLALNSELRAAISNILLDEEKTEYLNANGQGMTIAGGALQALGGILSGLGRNQSMTSLTPIDEATRLRLEEERRREREEEERKRKTNTAIGVTIGLVVLIGIVIAIIHASKKKQIPVPKTTVSVNGLNN